MTNNYSNNDNFLRDSFERIYKKDESERKSYLEKEAKEYILSNPNFSLENYYSLYGNYELKANLRNSFVNITKTHDLLQKELDLSREAKKIGIPLKEYRCLYELRKEVTFIQDYPVGLNPIEWIKYIYNLKSSQRKSLLDKIFIIPSLIKAGTIVTALASLGGFALYLYEMPQREKQSQYQAWDIINGAKGQTGEGGRIKALEDLVKSKVVLENIDVSNAFLSGINLSKSRLNKANFKQATLSQATFNEAILNNAHLDDANLSKANLRDAKLIFAVLTGADLNGVNLANANLTQSNFAGADLRDADLRGAIFNNTILSCSPKSCTNLKGAKIELEEIKQAKDWDKACYDPNIASQLGQKPELQNQKCSKIDRS